VQNTTEVVQGAASLELDGDVESLLESTAAEFESHSGTSITFGGWFRVFPEPGYYVSPVQKHEGDSSAVGYKMVRATPNDSLRCYFSDHDSEYYAVSEVWRAGEWIHAVCRFDNEADRIAAFVNGDARGGEPHGDVANSSRPFSLSGNQSSFTGQMDEVFYVNTALSDGAIVRIWACGLDGSVCRCNADDPSQYEHCGRAHPGCGALIACNQPSP
jgi:hypothetical protein